MYVTGRVIKGSQGHDWPPNVKGAKKRMWPDRDSNIGSLAYRASTLPLSYRTTLLTGYIYRYFFSGFDL